MYKEPAISASNLSFFLGAALFCSTAINDGQSRYHNDLAPILAGSPGTPAWMMYYVSLHTASAYALSSTYQLFTDLSTQDDARSTRDLPVPQSDCPPVGDPYCHSPATGGEDDDDCSSRTLSRPTPAIILRFCCH